MVFFILGNVIKNSWWFLHFECVIYRCQSEEDAGSAGEQPVRNKIDAYTKKVGWTISCSTLNFFW